MLIKIASNVIPNIDLIYILYNIHNIPIGIANNLYIFVFFCQTEYVYSIVANTDNKLKNPS